MRIEIGDAVRFMENATNHFENLNGRFAIVTATHPNMEFRVLDRENYSMPWQDLGDVGDDAPTYEFYADTFYKVDGDGGAYVDFDSIGFLDFGNDDLWEVYTPRVFPEIDPEAFVQNNFPVWLASHSSFHDWVPLPDFLGQYAGRVHINEIIMQLGGLLTTYVNENRSNSPQLHKASPLESSVDAAEEWNIDARMAERERDK